MVSQEHERIKTWLRRYGELSSEAAHLFDQSELIRSRLEAPGAPRLDGMPRAPGFEGDRTGEEVARIDELERAARRAQKAAITARLEVEAAIDKIHGRGWPDQRAVLRLWYIDLMPWPDVSEFLFGDNGDFWSNPERFQRRVFRIHAAALAAIAEFVPLEAGQELIQTGGVENEYL